MLSLCCRFPRFSFLKVSKNGSSTSDIFSENRYSCRRRRDLLFRVVLWSIGVLVVELCASFQKFTVCCWVGPNLRAGPSPQHRRKSTTCRGDGSEALQCYPVHFRCAGNTRLAKAVKQPYCTRWKLGGHDKRGQASGTPYEL